MKYFFLLQQTFAAIGNFIRL